MIFHLFPLIRKQKVNNMQVVGNFNKVSEELLKTIPPLENGKTQWFKALWGRTEKDMDGVEHILYGKKQIQTKDRIKDSGNKGKMVEIGIPLDIDDEKVISTVFFMPGQGEHVFSGVFGFTGGIVEYEEKYEFCML